MINYRKDVDVAVTQRHIDEAKCGDPNRCMVKLAVIEAIGKRCYCKVDLTGISLTRRGDYRERAFMPRQVARHVIRFDNDKNSVRPFTFKLHFEKTTKIVSLERKQEVVRKRHEAKANGIMPKKYKPAKRVSGVSMEAAGL